MGKWITTFAVLSAAFAVLFVFTSVPIIFAQCSVCVGGKCAVFDYHISYSYHFFRFGATSYDALRSYYWNTQGTLLECH